MSGAESRRVSATGVQQASDGPCSCPWPVPQHADAGVAALLADEGARSVGAGVVDDEDHRDFGPDARDHVEDMRLHAVAGDHDRQRLFEPHAAGKADRSLHRGFIAGKCKNILF